MEGARKCRDIEDSEPPAQVILDCTRDVMRDESVAESGHKMNE
jgi:hypothetical protein